jgi:hypothetical protein
MNSKQSLDRFSSSNMRDDLLSSRIEPVFAVASQGELSAKEQSGDSFFPPLNGVVQRA